jgi:hypothetical protein
VIERGERGVTLLTLLMIAKSFGITVSELLAGLEKSVAKMRPPKRATHSPRNE